MLDFLINFLTKLKEKKLKKERGELPVEGNLKRLSLIFLGVSMLLWLFFLQWLTILENRHYYLDYFVLKQIASFLVKILLAISLYRVFKNKVESIGKYFYLIFFPLALVSMFMTIPDNKAIVSLIVYLTIIFPILNILKIEKLEKAKNISLIYNVWFYIFLAIYILLLTIWMRGELFAPYWFIIENILNEDEFVLLPLLFFSLTYGIYSLQTYFEELKFSRKWFFKWAGLFLMVIFVIFIWKLVPSTIDYFYKWQIKDARNIIEEWWENAKTYNEAREQWFLERAFFNRIKENWSLYGSELRIFNKIYDASPESYFGEKIAEYTNNRSSFETNLSKIWDKAEVVLNLGEITNNVIISKDSSTFPILETTYKFHFTN